jgi:hypothetical protein
VSTGRHAAGDGSFSKSASRAALKGAGLLLVAVVLGIVLLAAADKSDPFQAVKAGNTNPTTPTTLPVGSTTTTSGVANTTTSVAAARPPAQVKVLVANGTTVKGRAGFVSQIARRAGFNTLQPADIAKVDKPVHKSAVYYRAGYEAEAKAVAAALGLPPTAVLPIPATLPVASQLAPSANVIVVIGTDSVSATGTTTTAPKTTTTTKKP